MKKKDAVNSLLKNTMSYLEQKKEKNNRGFSCAFLKNPCIVYDFLKTKITVGIFVPKKIFSDLDNVPSDSNLYTSLFNVQTKSAT